MPKKSKSNYQSFQTGKGGRMAALYFDMIDSEAWGKLTGNDIKLYIYFLRKYDVKYIGNSTERCNKNDISMPRSEFSTFMSQKTFEGCIDHLIELGFIRVVQYKATGFNKETIIYGFSDMWKCYGSPQFHITDTDRRICNRKEW